MRSTIADSSLLQHVVVIRVCRYNCQMHECLHFMKKQTEKSRRNNYSCSSMLLHLRSLEIFNEIVSMFTNLHLIKKLYIPGWNIRWSICKSEQIVCRFFFSARIAPDHGKIIGTFDQIEANNSNIFIGLAY